MTGAAPKNLRVLCRLCASEIFSRAESAENAEGI